MDYDDISWSEARNKMTEGALNALKEIGYSLTRIPGRGRASNWIYKAKNEHGKLCIRTSNDRWFAFPSENGGWKTLDDMDKVVVVAVDNPDNPQEFNIHLFKADEVRRRFNDSREARVNAGMTVREGYGMWVGLDKHNETGPTYIGSGIGDEHPAISTIKIFPEQTDAASSNTNFESKTYDGNLSESSIESIIEAAKSQISQKAGISIEKISLELKFDF